MVLWYLDQNIIKVHNSKNGPTNHIGVQTILFSLAANGRYFIVYTETEEKKIWIWHAMIKRGMTKDFQCDSFATIRFKISSQTWHRTPYSKSYDPD